MLLMYALFGLTYKFKHLDYVMLASWIYYFLFSFRNEFFLLKIRTQPSFTFGLMIQDKGLVNIYCEGKYILKWLGVTE